MAEKIQRLPPFEDSVDCQQDRLGGAKQGVLRPQQNRLGVLLLFLPLPILFYRLCPFLFLALFGQHRPVYCELPAFDAKLHRLSSADGTTRGEGVDSKRPFDDSLTESKRWGSELCSLRALLVFLPFTSQRPDLSGEKSG